MYKDFPVTRSVFRLETLKLVGNACTNSNRSPDADGLRASITASPTVAQEMPAILTEIGEWALARAVEVGSADQRTLLLAVEEKIAAIMKQTIDEMAADRAIRPALDHYARSRRSSRPRAHRQPRKMVVRIARRPHARARRSRTVRSARRSAASSDGSSSDGSDPPPHHPPRLESSSPDPSPEVSQ